MIFQVTLSNKAHPEYGQATIPFPISGSDYDYTLELLERLGIGGPMAQDCRVEELDSPYPILNRLVTQRVNVDELDYLAKRLRGFCTDEGVQFQAAASMLCLSDIKDFINLTFCCQQATVITDFFDLEGVGKSHSLIVNGGSMPMDEFEKVDGLATALDLIQSGAGVVTPYGVAYDNGMKLEQLYAGRSFPQYQYEESLLTLGVLIQPESGGSAETAWLYLPAPEQQIARTLSRIGITNDDAAYYIEDSTLPPKILDILERPDDAISELNRLCQAIRGLDDAGLKKLEAVVLMAQPEEAGEIRQLAENLDQFAFIPGVELSENCQVNELGYVAYHGSLTLEDLMREDPAEQYQREQEMGGNGAMILQLNCKGHSTGLRLPAHFSDVKQTLSMLREGLEPATPIQISSIYGDACSICQYIQHTNLESGDDVQKLNQLAGIVDCLGTQEQHTLSGALAAESINSLDDVLRVASSLDQYEFIKGITSDNELGGWLVEHGQAGVDFPESVRPYLDYAGIGAEYYASHGGAYTPNGYVKRRENAQTQATSGKPVFALMLASSFGSLRLDLPATDSELGQAVSVLQVSHLDCAMIDEVDIGYPWAHLLPKEDLTVDHANALAQYVSTMSETELRTFGAALEMEDLNTFFDALCIAENIGDYELVDGSEGEYGREALRYAGAGDEILDMLDGFTDFDALGRFEMEQDGVRETSYGSIKRLSSPFPQQAEQGQTMY